MCSVRIEPMRFTIPPKGRKRVDLLIEPVRTGEWEQVLRWKYYDDFKMNSEKYP